MAASALSPAPAPAAGPPNPGPAGPAPAAWGDPLARLDAAWTRLESLLCAGVLVAEIAALCVWIAMKGLSTPSTGDAKAGIVFRGVIGALALGLASRLPTRGRPAAQRDAITVGAVVVGLLSAGLWSRWGVDYFSNVLNWLQDGSTLTLIGGLRGLGTRLTLWLALLGASLATASGKHINVDVVMRFLSDRARLPVAVAGWLLAATVCLTAVWGFFDHIAIESFATPADAPPGAKVAQVAEHTGQNLFLLRKQVALDLRTLGHVSAGERYDRWMTGAEWNAWIKGGGWEEHWSQADLATVLVPEGSTEPKPPLVVVPNGSNRGILGHDLDLVVPFGLLMIGLRFVLRALLAFSGHVKVDPDAAHDDGDTHHGPEPDGDAVAAGAEGAS
jgi:hypothetical protein